MFRHSISIKNFFFIIVIITNNSVWGLAQDAVTEVVSAPRAVGRTLTKNADENTEKVSTVRGRVFYRDSGAPVRRGWIGLRKIKEFVEPPKSVNESKNVFVSAYSYRADNYVLTDDQGEFEIKTVKAGIYQPFLKVRGVLNPGSGDLENPLFQQISIDGVSEVQTSIGILRGAAVSGKISYADGSPVVGAKVEVLLKDQRVSRYSYYDEDNNNVTTTDDRGIYRLSGLPAGDYNIRVVELSLPANSVKGLSDYNLNASTSGSQLKTYYPNADNKDDAASVQMSLGVEQPDINVVIPDRRLLTVSGRVIDKSDKKAVIGATLKFLKINDIGSVEYVDFQNQQVKTDASGNWKFQDLPKGKYRITASLAPEYVYENQKTVLKNPEIKYALKSTEINLEENNAENVVIELSVEATVSGFVSVEGKKPLPDRFYMSVISEDLLNSASASSNNESASKDDNQMRRSFTIGGVSEGKFYILGGAGADYFIKSVRYGDKDLLEETLDVESGKKIENIEVVLSSETGTIKGKVTDFDKNKRGFAILFPSDKKGLFAFSSARQGAISDTGEFNIKAAPGEYFIYVAPTDKRPDFRKFDEWFKELRSKAQKVNVRLNETTDLSLNYSEK